METSDDAVLGGRLVLRQPRKGHRVGHDAILLAAATGARAGEHAAEFGAGVGAAALALARRVPGLTVTLVEIDPALAALAAHNAVTNGFAARVRAVVADAANAAALAAAGLAPGSIDRVLMNPPFNDPRRHNASPDARRRLAHVAGPDLLRRWIVSGALLLKPRGTLTLVWRADAEGEVVAALAPEFGDAAVLPVLPRPGATPIRVLVRAVKGGTGTRGEEASLVLNDADGGPSAEAEAVLRGGATLSLAAVV